MHQFLVVTLLLIIVVSVICSKGVQAATAAAVVKVDTNAARGECIPSQEDLSAFHCFDNAGRGIKCLDEEADCTKWAKSGECTKNPQYMLINCRKSCESCIGLHIGEPQVSPDEGSRDKLVQRLIETQEYIHEEAMFRVSTLKKCQNQHKLCTHWAVQGQCDTNADFMKETCAPACQTCRKLF